MPTVTRNGQTIHFTREGSGSGVLLVPGLGSGSRLFGTLPRRFAREGFTCAAIDPVGVPPSSPLAGGDYDFESAALDVLAVAAALPAPVALIGTSLGGKVALTAAALHGQAIGKLIMLCSAAVPTNRSRRVYRWFELLSTEVAGRWLGDMIAPFLFGESFHERRPGVVDDIARSSKPSEDTRALMRAQARALGAFDGRAYCSRVACPTLCLAGAEDALAPAAEVERTAALIAAAEYHNEPTAGHSLLLESAAAVERIVAFLRR